MPELLSPAGNWDSFIGVMNAGADAVYLGGDKFNARAYADNFTTKQLVEALQLAHLHGKKIYLTLNTLIKEREFGELYDYIAPLYEAGLDGIIIQDFGVLSFCKKFFPEMELHASTQMTVTGSEGVRFLQEQGVCRVVPARELSLEELIRIKKDTGVALETFIHGAICYCYSGQCLFSSFLGGRSGNRGRCAQPCRLPYTVKGREGYPLSLKDMCTIKLLPKLMDAGIDSFKIEGRMKKPAYAAGVTAIYRKYIDRYLADPNPAHYQVEKKDLDLLSGLYIRSERSEGYYERRNGKEMITLDQPGYVGTDEALAQRITNEYVRELPGLPIDMEVLLTVGEPAQVKIRLEQAGELQECRITGNTVQAAQNRPATEADIRKQFAKLGNTPYILGNFICNIKGAVFVPVGELNALRREAVEALQQKTGALWKRTLPETLIEEKEADKSQTKQSKSLSVSVVSLEQLQAFAQQAKHWEFVSRVYIPDNLWEKGAEKIDQLQHDGKKCYLRFPRISRGGWNRKLETMLQKADGVLLANLEQLQYLREKGMKKPFVADASLYVWNREAEQFLAAYVDEITLPLELNQYEKRELGEGCFEEILYGRTALMHTANCIRKTCGTCRYDKEGRTQATSKKGETEFWNLTDRYHKNFPVQFDCAHCTNIIYNSVPQSLHGVFTQIMEQPSVLSGRLEFTDEPVSQMEDILDYFHGRMSAQKGNLPQEEHAPGEFPLKEYTTGHYKRGVE
mgnify:FL=1